MEKTKKIKIFIGIFYIILVGVFLFLFFSNFTLQEITSYDFIKNNRDYFSELRKSNLILLSILFMLFTIVWVLAGGFGSPIALFAGFVFGKWLGVFIVAIGLAVGATFLYIFANYFLKDFIKEKFLNKFKNLEYYFKKSEFTYMLIYRFIGGIPWQLSCLLPALFNVKLKNYFFATLIGIIPSTFIVVSIGSGFEKIIDRNEEVPLIRDIILSPDIYIPILAFFALVLITILLRKFFYKN